MQDNYGREISVLRISVTDLCNYRCKYCMGEDGIPKRTHRDVLSFEEITRIASVAAGLGIRKIRLTGGEPLVRRGILDLCRMLKSIPEIKELSMTTNGSFLTDFAAGLKDAGVDRLNISLDTLDPEKFHSMTRTGSLEDVLHGIETAEQVGFTGTKLNAVLIGGFNDTEIPAFAELTKSRDLSVRFIELMPLGCSANWDSQCFLSSDAVLKALPDLEFVDTDGVSVRYRLPGYRGTIGLIPPMSRKFCSRCNRIRLTADGKLKPCLHSAAEIPLTGLSDQKLENALKAAILSKPKEHLLNQTHQSGTLRNMYEIGG